MKKTHEFKGIWSVLVIASIVIMIGGMVWCTYNFISLAWNNVLSPKELFLLNWKGVSVMLSGYFLFQLCLKKAK